MTNEDAIKILSTLYSTDVYVNDALDLAIKTLETGEIYMTGEDYNLYMEGYKAGKKDFEPKQGEWICPNCELYEQAEDDYCRYAGECTIGCHQCRYFEQKGGVENG